MASPVYSTRFIDTQTLADGANYTVPSGFRAVVKTITVWPFVAGSGFEMFLVNETTTGLYWLQVTVGGPSSFEHDTRLVFDEGEVMSLQTNYTGTMHGSVHGFLLTLP